MKEKQQTQKLQNRDNLSTSTKVYLMAATNRQVSNDMAMESSSQDQKLQHILNSKDSLQMICSEMVLVSSR